jgi:glycosyltransferase involved in cell wall biosynthesis
MIDSGGLSHYTAYLAVGLSKYRDIILYGLSAKSYMITGASQQNRIRFYDMSEKLPKGCSLISNGLRPLLFLLPLLKALVLTNYDIVHIQGYSYMFFLFIPFLKLKKKLVFWTMHDVDFRPSNDGIRGKLESLQVRIFCQNGILGKHADVIIVHGQGLKEKLKSRGICKDKIHVIPHFDYEYLLDSKLEIKASNEYVLMFGKIKPYKGLDIFLKAIPIVNEKLGDKINVMIAGKGNISNIVPLIRNSDTKFIHILNRYIEDNEIASLVANSKFLVLPYTDGSQSGVIPLAYTFSKPVIVSDVGSIAEYVDHDVTGLVFEKGNTNQLAACLTQMVQDTKRCIEMGKNGNDKMKKEMSLDKCSFYLNQLYSQYQR